MELTERLIAVEEKMKVVNHRLDDVEKITDSIHQIAVSVEKLTVQVGHLTDRLDDSLDDIKAGQRSQGERIGALEAKPAKRWEAVVGQIIGLVVAAVVGGFLVQFTNGG